MQNFMDSVCAPIVMLNDYVTACRSDKPKLQVAEKAVVVELKPVETSQDVLFSKMWNIAEKVGDVVLNVIEHPLTKRLVKGVFNQAIDRAEIGAMEKAVDLLGDKVLPGDVAAIKLAIMLITGFSAISKQ